jgi:hypothetical protein
MRVRLLHHRWQPYQPALWPSRSNRDQSLSERDAPILEDRYSPIGSLIDVSILPLALLCRVDVSDVILPGSASEHTS